MVFVSEIRAARTICRDLGAMIDSMGFGGIRRTLRAEKLGFCER